MTELQAAVGIEQISKLNFILKKNRANKKYLKKKIKKNQNFEYRIINGDEELADTLILILNNKNNALNLVKKLKEKKFETKNLPDAINWHFAGNWEHMFKKGSRYKNNFKTKWKKSRNLLERSVALPILVKSKKKNLDLLSNVINKFFHSI